MRVLLGHRHPVVFSHGERARGAASSPVILIKALIGVLASGPQEKLSFPPPGELPDLGM